MVELGDAEPALALGQARASLSRGKSSDLTFSQQLIEGVLASREAIDQALAPHWRGWSVRQMSAVDQTILRIAAYELLFSDAPPAAVIDEAVTLAKTYSTPDSGRFVNGVLGSLSRAGTLAILNSDQSDGMRL